MRCHKTNAILNHKISPVKWMHELKKKRGVNTPLILLLVFL